MSNEIVLKALEDHAKAMEGFRSGIQSDISGIQEQMKNLSHEVDNKLGVRKNLSALDVLGGGRGSMTFENVLTGDITDEAGNLIKGRIKGLVEQGMDFVPSGVADPSTLTPTDRIGAAVVNLQANGWKPGLIIMNPVDWQLISSQKGTDGQYVLGSPRDPSPLTLWNVPVVLTPSLARNISIVMDPAQAAILDREQPSLLASREDGQNFTTNMVTLLGELRAGLAVFAPGAVLIVDVNGDLGATVP